MKIKIVSDGTTQGTRVLDLESGQEIPGVQMINWMIGLDGLGEAMIHLQGVQCEILTSARQALVPDLNPFDQQVTWEPGQ